MNRRRFFSSIGAAAAIAALPVNLNALSSGPTPPQMPKPEEPAFFSHPRLDVLMTTLAGRAKVAQGLTEALNIRLNQDRKERGLLLSVDVLPEREGFSCNISMISNPENFEDLKKNTGDFIERTLEREEGYKGAKRPLLLIITSQRDFFSFEQDYITVAPPTPRSNA